jgi:hypothetical protein
LISTVAGRRGVSSSAARPAIAATAGCASASPPPRSPGWVVVTAPGKPAKVKLTPAGGAPITVRLDKSGMGLATLAPDAAATVTSYAADGSAMGATPVPPFDDGSGVIGETAATRVVP